jgi:hypothetical protein
MAEDCGAGGADLRNAACLKLDQHGTPGSFFFSLARTCPNIDYVLNSHVFWGELIPEFCSFFGKVQFRKE